MTDRSRQIARMKELSQKLKEASRAYYQQNIEQMSNLEYDRLYEELEALEQETGVVLAGSPTVSVGYESVDELPKERHPRPMLSLDKTKDPAQLKAFIGNQKTLLSWKLDGLTVVLTYQGGILQKAVTRGNGEIGEVITPNARCFINLPLSIPWQGTLILRGEAVISYPDFARINDTIVDAAARYKNPRNLCSGSVRQLNSQVTADRSVRFYAFGLVEAEGVWFDNSREKQFSWLEDQGFEVVPYLAVRSDGVDEALEGFARRIRHFEIPSDGLVALYDDIAYGESLGATAKFPRDSFAFKWRDELAETKLRYVEWSASRTGLLNPVAVFEPVSLEGTTVSRASVHNVSILRSLRLGTGDTLRVYKANMIIPQIAENLTGSDTIQVPECCPVCGGRTRLQTLGEVQTLFCDNPDCMAKQIKALELFVGRNGLNMEGLSGATLEKFVAAGYIHTLTDLFHLARHRAEIVAMEGFGEKSYEHLMESVERSRKTTLPRLIYALGIPGIGSANARLIAQAFSFDVERLRGASQEELEQIPGIGPVLAAAIGAFFSREANQQLLTDLLEEVTLDSAPATEGSASAPSRIAGKTFVVTGALKHYPNREALKEEILQLGGKVTGSVSKQTDYLINNDANSGSAKNRKARELGVWVITEEAFMQMRSGAAAEPG